MPSLILCLGILSAPAAMPARDQPPPLLITEVTVIPADTDDVLDARYVLIRDGRIATIATRRPRHVRPDTVTIDGRGKFLVPGFIDAHVHIATEGAIRGSKDTAIAGLDLGDDHAYDEQVLLTLLRAGVTGAANLGGSVASDDDLLWLRDEIKAGRVQGPRLFVGKYINGPRAAVVAPRGTDVPPSSPGAPTNAADGVAAVKAARERGYDFIKPYQFLNRETYAAIVDEARRLGVPTSGHLPELGCASCADRAFAFSHKLDNIAHAEELARYGRESDFAPADIDTLADLVAQREVAVTPTLITLKTIIHMYTQRDVPAVPAPWDDWVDPITRLDWDGPQNRYLSEAFRRQPEAGTFSAGYDFARLLTRQLWKRGVTLTVGTDAPMPGLPFGVSVHQEMAELREIGLSPLLVLRAASLNARKLFAPALGNGAVRPGQLADLVLLDANPLDDIRNVSRIAGVVTHGRWLSRDDMDRHLAELAQRSRALERQLQLRRTSGVDDR
ncbi:MAG: imidazolonepropionase [Rhodanobacteraceae bacterium]